MQQSKIITAYEAKLRTLQTEKVQAEFMDRVMDAIANRIQQGMFTLEWPTVEIDPIRQRLLELGYDIHPTIQYYAEKQIIFWSQPIPKKAEEQQCTSLR